MTFALNMRLRLRLGDPDIYRHAKLQPFNGTCGGMGGASWGVITLCISTSNITRAQLSYSSAAASSWSNRGVPRPVTGSHLWQATIVTTHFLAWLATILLMVRFIKLDGYLAAAGTPHGAVEAERQRLSHPPDLVRADHHVSERVTVSVPSKLAGTRCVSARTRNPLTGISGFSVSSQKRVEKTHRWLPGGEACLVEQ